MPETLEGGDVIVDTSDTDAAGDAANDAAVSETAMSGYPNPYGKRDEASIKTIDALRRLAASIEDQKFPTYGQGADVPDF